MSVKIANEKPSDSFEIRRPQLCVPLCSVDTFAPDGSTGPVDGVTEYHESAEQSQERRREDIFWCVCPGDRKCEDEKCSESCKKSNKDRRSNAGNTVSVCTHDRKWPKKSLPKPDGKMLCRHSVPPKNRVYILGY